MDFLTLLKMQKFLPAHYNETFHSHQCRAPLRTGILKNVKSGLFFKLWKRDDISDLESQKLALRSVDAFSKKKHFSKRDDITDLESQTLALRNVDAFSKKKHFSKRDDNMRFANLQFRNQDVITRLILVANFSHQIVILECQIHYSRTTISQCYAVLTLCYVASERSKLQEKLYFKTKKLKILKVSN